MIYELIGKGQRHAVLLRGEIEDGIYSARHVRLAVRLLIRVKDRDGFTVVEDFPVEVAPFGLGFYFGRAGELVPATGTRRWGG